MDGQRGGQGAGRRDTLWHPKPPPPAGRNKGVYTAKGWLLKLNGFLACFPSLSPLEQHLQSQEEIFPKLG